MDHDYEMDTRHVGAGFVLGTASPVSPLNYRLSIGYEEISHLGDFESTDFTMHGIVVDQDLLISLTRGRSLVRVFFGPELRLGFLSGSPDHASGGDEDFLVIGLGPVMGVNFRVAPALLLSWKVGYLFSSYEGDNRSRDNGNGSASVVDGHAFANFSILFPTWGGYRRCRGRRRGMVRAAGSRGAPVGRPPDMNPGRQRGLFPPPRDRFRAPLRACPQASGGRGRGRNLSRSRSLPGAGPWAGRGAT